MESKPVNDVQSEKGFTMIELLIVIAIGAILGTITIWGVVTVLPKYRLDGAADTLRSDLYRAKILAANNRQNCTVVFNANGYAINVAGGIGTVASRNISQEYTGVSVDMGATTNPVFSPRGTASDVTITLRQVQGGLTAVITTTLAGRVKVQ